MGTCITHCRSIMCDNAKGKQILTYHMKMSTPNLSHFLFEQIKIKDVLEKNPEESNMNSLSLLKND